jgi:hypothetical protein
MRKKRLMAVLAVLAVLAGLGAYLGLRFHADGRAPPAPVPPVVAQVEPSLASASSDPPPAPIHGLIHEVSEYTVATSSGDVHIRTADGAYYDFQLIGEFTAVKSTTDDLEIQVRLAPWQGSSRSVSTNVAVAVKVAGDRVGFYAGRQTGFYVDGRPATFPDEGKAIALPKGGQVARVGGRFVVVWPDQTEVRVALQGSYLDLAVDLAGARAGKVVGLFGNFDGNAANDLISREGIEVTWPELIADAAGGRDPRKALYEIFGDTWRIRQSDSLFDYEAGESTSTWTDLQFPYAIVSTRGLDDAARARAKEVCTQAGISDTHFLDNCIIDVAVTGEGQFARSARQSEEDVKLPSGFHCRTLRAGGTRCTNYEPSLPGARIGAPFEIAVETMAGAAKQTESFDCTLIDMLRRASCTITTKGALFVGSNVVRQYQLDDGEVHKEKGTMRRE